jgi:hypothetical protein
MLREVRLALLEADVALPVVKELINNIKQKALGVEVLDSLSPGQALVGVVQARNAITNLLDSYPNINNEERRKYKDIKVDQYLSPQDAQSGDLLDEVWGGNLVKQESQEKEQTGPDLLDEIWATE